MGRRARLLDGSGQHGQPLARLYENGLRAALPEFAALVDWLGGLNACPAEVQFIDKISSFPMSGAAPAIPADCICAVAESLRRRSQLCTLERLRIDGRAGPTAAAGSGRRRVGVPYRAANIFIADVAQLNCPGLQGRANLQMEQQTGLCPVGEERTCDGALRDTLGLIRKTDLPDDQAARAAATPAPISRGPATAPPRRRAWPAVRGRACPARS